MSPTTTIALTLGLSCIIDADDFHIVSGRKWQARKRRDGKAFYAVDWKGVRMHRLLLEVSHDVIVDHVNGDGLDNRRCNIRIGSQSQNCVNRKSTPGQFLRGARPKKNRWQAYLKHKGVFHHIGYFATEQEAHKAYLHKATELHGDWMPLLPAPSQPVREGGQT